MFEIEQADVEPGVVVQVAQPGWTLHDVSLTRRWSVSPNLSAAKMMKILNKQQTST